MNSNITEVVRYVAPNLDDGSRAYMAEHKWVRIMNDVYAYGVWGEDGGAYTPLDLPISKELQARIFAWAKSYDEASLDQAAMSREGLAIARDVKAELPEWTVVYFDEDKVPENFETVDRTVFEYEISLQQIKSSHSY